MSKFGGSTSTNDELIRWQKDEAAKAEAKDAELRQRRQAAMDKIRAIYDGGTITGPSTFKEETVTKPNPAYTPAAAKAYDPYTAVILNALGGKAMIGGLTFSQTPMKPTITETVRTEIPGQKTTYAGIGDDFYDGFRKAVVDYYQPQLDDRFEDAMSQTFFDAVRRGTARSSAYADNTADLTKQKGVQSGNIYLDADQQTAELRNRVNREKQAAMELAGMAEDPTIAVDRALTEVNAIQNTSPALSPLGDVFTLAASVYNSYNDAQRRRQFMSGIPTSNPYTSAGRVIR